MPPKRAPKTRRRSAQRDTIASSPTRPLKRRKKSISPPPVEEADDDGSALAPDQSGLAGDEDDEVSQVAAYLLCPSNPVQASIDYANAAHEAPEDGFKAYAKIAARDWTFFITRPSVNIGRSSDPPQPVDDEEKTVHIDLGPSKMVSRLHGCIHFDSKEERWVLTVKGRNGAKVNNSLLKFGAQHTLTSGEVVDIGGVEMMFVLPSEISPLHIHQIYLERSGLLKQEAPISSPSSDPFIDAPAQSSASHRRKSSRSGTSQQPIAPPPVSASTPTATDDQRPGTPLSVPGRGLHLIDQSPGHDDMFFGQTATPGIDLSRDDNQHVKPHYSYAQLITQAIMNTQDGKLNLNGIYNFIMDNYSYYRHQQVGGWQNSIRHNLSLNKSFDKVARSTDEPGKGMKWQIVPEVKEEMVRNAYRLGRGGHRGSSAPSSPAQLSYISHGSKDMATSARKRKSPGESSVPTTPSKHVNTTPDRGTRRLAPAEFRHADDDSPLPRTRLPAATPSAKVPVVTHSPTLGSSYPPDETTSFFTPAPPRVQLWLAPPSTAQRPSQYLPTSSPAPFWKYADILSTPLKPAADPETSPSRGDETAVAPSSSPPRGNGSPATSPTRSQQAPEPAVEKVPVEEREFDLTKGFQSISSFHAPVVRGESVGSFDNNQLPNKQRSRDA